MGLDFSPRPLIKIINKNSHFNKIFPRMKIFHFRNKTFAWRSSQICDKLVGSVYGTIGLFIHSSLEAE